MPRATDSRIPSLPEQMPAYDRNLPAEWTASVSIGYLHLSPVRRARASPRWIDGGPVCGGIPARTRKSTGRPARDAYRLSCPTKTLEGGTT